MVDEVHQTNIQVKPFEEVGYIEFETGSGQRPLS